MSLSALPEAHPAQTMVKHPIRYRCKLDSLADCRREMARVYRESRSQIIDVSDGSKFVYMLGAVGKIIESSDLEQRIEALEAKQ